VPCLSTIDTSPGTIYDEHGQVVAKVFGDVSLAARIVAAVNAEARLESLLLTNSMLDRVTNDQLQMLHDLRVERCSALMERDSTRALLAEAVAALQDLRDAATNAYKAGRIPAEPFVRAGNVLAKVPR
jgi:glutamate mutase epsilon subunit